MTSRFQGDAEPYKGFSLIEFSACLCVFRRAAPDSFEAKDDSEYLSSKTVEIKSFESMQSVCIPFVFTIQNI